LAAMENASLSSDVWNDVTTSPSQSDDLTPHLANICDLTFKVIYIIIGTVGVIDNLFVLIIFFLFIKITEKVGDERRHGPKACDESTKTYSVCDIHQFNIRLHYSLMHMYYLFRPILEMVLTFSRSFRPTEFPMCFYAQSLGNKVQKAYFDQFEDVLIIVCDTFTYSRLERKFAKAYNATNMKSVLLNADVIPYTV